MPLNGLQLKSANKIRVMRNSFWISLRIFIILICYQRGCFSKISIQLVPVYLDVWVNTEATLNCSFGQPVNFVAWRLFTNIRNKDGAMIRGTDTTSCYANGFLSNSTLYTCSFLDNQTVSVKMKSIADQNHGDKWICGDQIFSVISNNVKLLVKVPVKHTTITPNDVFTTNENTSGSFVCKTSECRPEPKFLWYKQTSIQSDGGETITTETVPRNDSDSTFQSYNHTYIVTFNRTWNGGQLLCGATNREGSVVLSTRILINITYPPDRPPQIGLYQNGSTLKIIKNTSIDLVCSIAGGNPLPRLEWNEAGSFTQTLYDTVTNTLSWQAIDNDRHDLVCQSFHQHQNDITYVTLEVLYPPGAINVRLIIDSDSTSNIKHNFSVIENTSSTMLLICSARSNPSPNSYRWTGPIHSSSARLEINMTRYVRGTYTCHVNNTMIAHDGRTEHGYNSAPYIVEILQSPDIGRLDDAKAVEGNTVSITCPIISGNDTWRSVTWLYKQSVQVGQNGYLFIKNVTRIASGTYTCQVNFTLQPTYGSPKIKTITKSLYLDVLYQAEILSLSINNEKNSLTVNESARAEFVCNVDSNPKSTVEITLYNKVLSTKANIQTLEYLIPSANCNDTGTYVCTGSNVYNAGQKARLESTFVVLCSPRQSPSFELKQNVTSALNDSATFQYTALAYPPPSFQWFRLVNGSETSENLTGVITSHNISTTEMQINFTLDNVEMIQYGEYLLKVENQYGTYSQTFFLVAEGKPTPPTNYDFFPDSVTSDSVTIWWEPGFDRGLPLSFIISYNLTSSKWYNETAISHNKERKMNKTITELTSGSVYHVLIYAQNVKGAVRVSHAIIVNTKEVQLLSETLTKSKSVGPAVGGTVGALLAVITVTVSLVIVRKRQIGKRTSAQNKASDLNDLYTYQNFQSDGQSSSEGPSSAVYERLHHTDGQSSSEGPSSAVYERLHHTDGQISSEGPSSAVYERLHHTDSESDQQYQQLAKFTETDAPRVYENLKLSRQNKENNVRGSRSGQNASAHNQTPV